MLRLISIFSMILFLAGCTSKSAEVTAPIDRSAELELLFSGLTGTFQSEDGVSGKAETFYSVDIPETGHSLYVEIQNTETGTPVYQAVWKFFQVGDDLELQFWRITDPARYAGAYADEELLGTLWMYHLRELGGCRMTIDVSTTPDALFKGQTSGEDCFVGKPIDDRAQVHLKVTETGFALSGRGAAKTETAKFERVE